jgi:selenocysteine lyase/cysteine desulfurase
MGFAWCRREAINRLPTFREDFIPDVTPDKLEAGTYAYENVAGMDVAVDYIEEIGRGAGGEGHDTARTSVIHRGMNAIAAYERTLSAALLDAVGGLPGVTIYGVTDRARLDARVPTLCFSVAGIDSAALAARVAKRDIGIRSGHMYSPRLVKRLGRMPAGVVRASLVHYNTIEEIGRFRDVLGEAIGAVRRADL